MNSTVASKPAPYQELMEFLGKREASWEITADAVDEIIDLLGGPSKRPKAESWPAAQAPQPDANGWYYHRAPTVDRARIQQHGLQPSLPRNNPHWPDNRLVRNQPEGVYVTSDPEGISYMLGGPTDVWRIPATSVQSIERDPAMYGKGYIPHRVDDAELWQPYERSNSFTGVPLSDEDLFWNADYPHQLAYDLDHYDEQRQQGNPWKIGLPTTAALTTGWKIHERSDERQSQTSVSQTTDIWTNAHEANAALWELADLMRKIPVNQQAQANEVMRHEGVKSAIAYVLKLLQQQWTITPTETQPQPQEAYDDASVWTEPALGPLDGVWSSVRQGGMTVPQQQRFKQQLEERLGPEQTNVVHTFPDGWTIRHLPTWGEIGREGEMMHHCWAGLGDDYPNEPAGDGEDISMSLRDPNNWPHASFSYHVPSKTPYEFGGHGGYGIDDEDPKWDYIDQWSKATGGNFTHPMAEESDLWTAKTATYQPDPEAPEEGEWVRGPDPTGQYPQGIATGWRQSHDTLVQDALQSMKGWGTDVRLHWNDEPQGEAHLFSNHKRYAQAQALKWELANKAKPNHVPLYRGSHVPPSGVAAWTEDPKIAQWWAKKGGGQVHTLQPGEAHGLRIADYGVPGIDELEREWLIDHGRTAKTADNFTNDSREWPDPTEPRASKPPAPRGCTCQWGDKLNCPVHGLNADPELAQLDHSWSLPENSPVGYPQNADAPRTWQQATVSSSLASNTRLADSAGWYYDDDSALALWESPIDSSLANKDHRYLCDPMSDGEKVSHPYRSQIEQNYPSADQHISHVRHKLDNQGDWDYYNESEKNSMLYRGDDGSFRELSHPHAPHTRTNVHRPVSKMTHSQPSFPRTHNHTDTYGHHWKLFAQHDLLPLSDQRYPRYVQDQDGSVLPVVLSGANDDSAYHTVLAQPRDFHNQDQLYSASHITEQHLQEKQDQPRNWTQAT